MISSLCCEDKFSTCHGTGSTNLDKNRLVEIPPRGGEPPDGGIDKDSVSTLNATPPTKNATYVACKLHMHEGQSEPA